MAYSGGGRVFSFCFSESFLILYSSVITKFKLRSKMKKIITSIILILTLNSCFLGITGAPHSHLYREITGNSTIKVNVHCMYLNKTFEIRNSNPNDSLFIQSSSFKNPSEKNLLHFGLLLLADFSFGQISIMENSDANPSLLSLI